MSDRVRVRFHEDRKLTVASAIDRALDFVDGDERRTAEIIIDDSRGVKIGWKRGPDYTTVWFTAHGQVLPDGEGQPDMEIRRLIREARNG